MNDFYTKNWDKLHKVEGASQRVQEDTKRFAAIMEGLGQRCLTAFDIDRFFANFVGLVKNVTELPRIGPLIMHLFMWLLFSHYLGRLFWRLLA